jgi:hypothetical protein
MKEEKEVAPERAESHWRQRPILPAVFARHREEKS